MCTQRQGSIEFHGNLILEVKLASFELVGITVVTKEKSVDPLVRSYTEGDMPYATGPPHAVGGPTVATGGATSTISSATMTGIRDKYSYEL